jgi:hypothetical protein
MTIIDVLVRGADFQSGTVKVIAPFFAAEISWNPQDGASQLFVAL